MNKKRKVSSISKIFLSIIYVAMMSLTFSCSTGIESTKKIKMNKDDVKMMVKSDEQLLASRIKGIPLKDWSKGKKFLVMSDRSVYLFEQPLTSDDASSLQGEILYYAGTEIKTNPDLKEECVIKFTHGPDTYHYNTGKTIQNAMDEIDSSKIPLLADLDLVQEWKDKLRGKTLWTKNSLWYDESGQRKMGLKFAKVEIEDVLPTVGDFPMKVKLSHDGDISYVYMNYTTDTADSRNFAALFFLADPKLRYPNISDENWSLIQAGRVGKGMSKEECRLALGNPDELRTGHNTSQTLDIWQYGDGTYLFFTDGLLNSFRQ